MKRIIISLALLAACAIGAVIETAYISGSVDSYTETIDRIDGYMLRDDFENALRECSRLKRRVDGQRSRNRRFADSRLCGRHRTWHRSDEIAH